MKERLRKVIALTGVVIMFCCLFGKPKTVAASSLLGSPWITDDSIYYNTDGVTYVSEGVVNAATPSFSSSISDGAVAIFDNCSNPNLPVFFNYLTGNDLSRLNTYYRDHIGALDWSSIANNFPAITHYYIKEDGDGNDTWSVKDLFYGTDTSWNEGYTTSYYISGFYSDVTNNALFDIKYAYDALREGLDTWKTAVDKYNSSLKSEEDIAKLNKAAADTMRITFAVDQDDAFGDIGYAEYIDTLENAKSALIKDSDSWWREGEELPNDFKNTFSVYVSGHPAWLGGKYRCEAYIDQIIDVAMELKSELDYAKMVAVNNGVYAEEEEDVGAIEKGFSELARGIAVFLQNKLSKYNLTLDTIIYGRVKNGTGMPVRVNQFAFELEDGNPYGVAGAIVYSLLRGAFMLFFIILAMGSIAKGSFATAARSHERMKEAVLITAVSFVLLFLMPPLLHVLTYVRDNILGWIAPALNKVTGDDSRVYLSLASQFKKQADMTQSFGDACMFFGIVAVTVYFAFTYTTMAASATIMFAMFPMFCLIGTKNKKAIENWVMFVLGILATPMIDSVLFILPMIATSKSFNVSPLVQFLLCMSIIPARAMVRQLLGFGNSVGAELIGAGAMIMAGRMIGGAIRTVKNIGTTAAGAISGYKADMAEANTLDELSKTDNEINDVRREKYDYAQDKAVEIANGDIGEISMSYAGGADAGGADGKKGAAGIDIPDYGKDFKASLDSSTDLKTARQKVLDKHATIDNLDSRLMQGISESKRAELLRKRANKNLAKGLLVSTGQAVGGIGGGAVGFAATTFASPTGRILGTVGGFNVGAAVGGLAGNIAYAGAEGAGKLARSLKNVDIHPHFGKNAASPDDFIDDTKEHYEFKGGYTDEMLENELNELSSDTASRDATTSWMNLDNDEYVDRARMILDTCKTFGNEAQMTRAIEGIGDIVNRNSGLGAKGYSDDYTTSCKMGVVLDDAIRSIGESYEPTEDGYERKYGTRFANICNAYDGNRAAGEKMIKYVGQNTRLNEAYGQRMERTAPRPTVPQYIRQREDETMAQLFHNKDGMEIYPFNAYGELNVTPAEEYRRQHYKEDPSAYTVSSNLETMNRLPSYRQTDDGWTGKKGIYYMDERDAARSVLTPGVENPINVLEVRETVERAVRDAQDANRDVDISTMVDSMHDYTRQYCEELVDRHGIEINEREQNSLEPHAWVVERAGFMILDSVLDELFGEPD